MPSNRTRTPPSVVSMNPCGVTCADTGVAGPRSVPKIVAIRPGTATVGTSEAAFTTDLTCGTTGVLTFSVTFTVCGLLLALELVTLTVPVYIPGDNPTAFTLTLMGPGVVPVLGVTSSHPPLDTAVAFQVMPGVLLFT